MNHSIERCRVCENYLRGIGNCKFCHFEWALDYPPTDDRVFDILEVDTISFKVTTYGEIE